ncbi:MAG: ABC transporter ATP-binding protein [bacterium]
MSPILTVENLSKVYQSGDRTLTVLHQVSLHIESGSACAIVGPSGSGKTTLLGLCAGLDLPSSGQVILNGTQLDTLSEDERARFRNRTLGFVFQSFQLIPTLTALENVMVPLELRGRNHVRAQARELLSQVGLGERVDHYPVQLSGGEQQRVAMARAFINQPRILFADEPTGNLDAETSERIVALLFELNHEHGTTLIMATHNLDLANRTDRIIRLRGGRLVADEDLRQSPETTREMGI